jgi:PAS domain S-box-containing protein
VVQCRMKRSTIIVTLNRTRTRSIVTLLLLFLAMAITFFYSTEQYRANLIELRKNELIRLVQISMNTISPIIDEYKAGSISREEALEEVVTLTRRMTYSSETMANYVFMSSYDGTMLVQPLEPMLQGTNQLQMQDSAGNYLVQDLIKTATSEEGEGFVTYTYPPPGSENPGEKLSYVRGIPELEVYIGTGMFYYDIEKLYRSYLVGPILVFLISFFGISVLLIVYLRPLLKANQFLLHAFHQMTDNPEDQIAVPFEQFREDTDERIIMEGFDHMVRSLHESRTELMESEQRYRHLYEESTGVRIILDRDGRIVDANTSFLNELGRTKDDFSGRPLASLAIRSHRSRTAEMLKLIRSGTYAGGYDLDIRDRGGKIRTILITGSYVLSGKTGHLLLSGVDITNRKQAEKQAALQREQLIQADKLASLGILVSGVAHEISNPNQFILSNTSLLQGIWDEIFPIVQEYREQNGEISVQGIPGSQLKEAGSSCIEGIVEGARRIDKIIYDLKFLSRDESGQPWSEVDVSHILRSSLNLCNNMISSSGTRLKLRLEENLPPVWGNAQQLEQVCINLLQNAVQAMEGPGKTLEISTSYEPDSGVVRPDSGVVRIEFSDEGVGMTKEQMKRLFDPFFTTKRESGGTGLGLSISSSIILEHRGRIEFSSEKGRGTRAVICLNSGGAQTARDSR